MPTEAQYGSDSLVQGEAGLDLDKAIEVSGDVAQWLDQLGDLFGGGGEVASAPSTSGEAPRRWQIIPLKDRPRKASDNTALVVAGAVTGVLVLAAGGTILYLAMRKG